MKFIPIIIFISLMFSELVSGQGYNIEVELESAPNKAVYLAHYYIENIYVDDTIQLDARGKGIFAKDTLLPQGLYKIYMDDKNHFDFLLGADQSFLISNHTFESRNTKISGAYESEEFVDYMNFLNNLKSESATIQQHLKNAVGTQKTELQNDLRDLNNNIQSYWNEIDKKYPNTFLASFLMSNKNESLDISTLPVEVQNNDSLLLIAKFKYQQEHYWDHFNYNDERFLYTPLLKPKLETWFTKVLYQHYDSVQPAVFELIEKVRPNKRIFQFVASFFLNSSIKSNILGMDALFIDLAKTYYLSGEAFWVTEESLKKIRENVQFIEPNLIGKTAPDLTLQSFDGEYYNLHKIDKKITAVLIYEPNCSHCKEFVPQFYNDIYAKYQKSGLEVYAIYSMDNKDEWATFLDKHKLWDWINVWDKEHTSGFKILYDARNTPAIFILDENKKIIAKKMSVKQIDKLIESYLN